ncbi:GNAT family N-acetyltransferase [Belnapia rosea]|uniref:GNAT family N-acetyltransferase n=1 Tax=Belnapia rosea TaxID=938405 RepID=UPI000B871BBB|nr:GNAT family N-acetyltransferase [Belnapia rosea]
MGCCCSQRIAWVRGCATEGAAALLAHAFATLGLPTTVAGINPPNFTSLRVAAKLGPVAQGRAGGYPRQALRRKEWLTVPGG